MKVSGAYPFSAPPEAVWEAICDPIALQCCIPQCEEVERVSPTAWKALARVKVGPAAVRFAGDITLSNVAAPESYSLSIVAKSWLGTSHGQADVKLRPEGSGTLLLYEAEVFIGIKLLDKAMDKADKLAKHLADVFFGRLAELVAERSRAHVSP